MNMFFTKPTQVKFSILTDDGDHIGGIAYHDKVICGCCGCVFDIEELLKDNPNAIIKLPYWVDINSDILGE